MQDDSITNNVLLSSLHKTPFTEIRNKDFIPAIMHSIELANTEINEIINSTSEPDFNNTIVKLEFSTLKLERINTLLTNKNRCYTDEETQKICKEASEIITKFKNSLNSNKQLFVKVCNVYERRGQLTLSTEDKTLLERKYLSFIRNGANLSDKDTERLSEINIELAKLILTFEENLLAEKGWFILHITDENDLKGLPEAPKASAKKTAEKKGLEGWVFTLDIPSYLPFITYAENRELRKKISIAYGSRAYRNTEKDNQEVVLKITKLRKEKANLLGYKTHADYVLADRMANTPDIVYNFIKEIRDKANPKAKEEIATLKAFAKELDGIEDFQRWDTPYYAEKLKKKLFDIDEEELRPYFELDKVLKGVLGLANTLYGITFTEVNDVDKFNKDVKTFEVKDNDGNFLAYFYTDFFPRDDKQNGGWVYTFKPQFNDPTTNENIRPHVGIFCNFPNPTDNNPSLLNYGEVETLFHEFGHALHSMFSNCKYPSLSGINVLWDFVELPSQIMENFCDKLEILKTFAFHYKTNELIPVEKVQKIIDSKHFNTGLATMRQLNFSYLDMSWHSENFPSTKDEIKKFEVDNMIEYFPTIQENCNIVSFLHLFNSTYDYSAGYYSYHWAEVLEQDAFELFSERGIVNPEIGREFRDKILKKGGSENPMILYKSFRGKDPTTDAFMKKKGLI